VLHVHRLAADALEGKGKGQHRLASASAADQGGPPGGASREQSPLLDTLLPGYLSRPNPSPVKVRHRLQRAKADPLFKARCGQHPVLKPISCVCSTDEQLAAASRRKRRGSCAS